MDSAQKCRLCLETSYEVLINVRESFQSSTIAEILSKYFWFQVLENDGVPEWLCQICWIQVKTFHSFYKRIELLHGNNQRPTDNVVCTDEIKRSGSVSPTALELDLTIVKCEGTELPLQNTDMQICEENSCNNSDDNICYETRSYEEKPKTNDVTEDNQLDYREQNNPNRLSQCEMDKQDAQIREFFDMKCDICSDVKFESFREMKQHYRRIHKTVGYLWCFGCGFKHKYRFRMLEHIQWHINPDAYHCDQCGKNFTTKLAMKNHIKNHQPADSHAFKCSMCPSSFAVAGTYKQHVKSIHTSIGERFSCDKCDKNFRTSLLLSHHIRNVHVMTQEYVCEVCAKKFKTKQTLQIHVTNKHSTTPPPKVQCDICGVWLKSLYKHQQRHKYNKPTNCPVCNKEVRSKDALRQHVSEVHSEKRYPCTLCDKTFKRTKNLREHFAIHTGEDLYDCPYCEKKFKSNANMYSHRKKAHLAEYTRDYPQRCSSKNLSATVEIDGKPTV